MDYRLGTLYEPCTILVNFRSLKPCTIRLQVFDAERANTVFTNRIIPCMVNETVPIQVPIPRSGRNVIIRIYDEMEGNRPNSASFEIVSIKKAGLRRFLQALDLTNIKLATFIDFAERFCFNAGTLPTNTEDKVYCSLDPDKTFKLQYLPVLLNKNGVEDVTPARVEMEGNRYEASRKRMISYTVPERMCIMCHEYAHNNENADPNNELEADINGLTIYLALGYSRIEAIETYTNTFSLAPSNDNVYNRFTQVQQYIDDFYNEFYFKKQKA